MDRCGEQWTDRPVGPSYLEICPAHMPSVTSCSSGWTTERRPVPLLSARWLTFAFAATIVSYLSSSAPTAHLTRYSSSFVRFSSFGLCLFEPYTYSPGLREFLVANPPFVQPLRDEVETTTGENGWTKGSHKNAEDR
ncbi:hypothetical protein SCLCIDRAFT_552332 [Scleroderma citrinum Foug A]|uniref:Uncharacterized protein n=1 Tax=Scleroderma citrinum Foug A TaxID=1036808 RepID=A0A0C3D8N1_9AGAM|nr:hypothetical protein SCLCIDRAFT_552332 [Scleroderma citrinum Foug A]